jgi:CubicO group peptidase (beta-lactamase class C family)/D-alanyl-D-alanine dipeptidase
MQISASPARTAIGPVQGLLALAAAGLLACAPADAPGTAASGRYADVVEILESFIQAEMDQKGLPALSVALVDDQETVWARGFGIADPGTGVPATESTVYRVGSVSKLFTDLAIMQRVERGELDLDAPVTAYLPDFAPENPFGGEITLRQLMSHRAGLVREPPVGHYFDPDEPTLAETVESLNATALVYPPESRHKYSNAGIAVVGYVLERLSGRPFAEMLDESVLKPLGMEHSAFVATPRVREHLAGAVMWSYDGREFAAPTFELGMSPAGSMYAPVTDLALFMSALFAGGQGPGGQVVTAETLEAMWTPQFDEPGATTGRGIGFGISELDGTRRVGHGGAIYGFSTELAALPDEKLGVVVTTTRDFSNAVTRRVATEALRLMRAARAGEPLVAPLSSRPLSPGQAAQLEGRYRSDERGFDFMARGDRLFVTPTEQGYTLEARALDGRIVLDDRMRFDASLDIGNGVVRHGGESFERTAWAIPEPPLASWDGLIGEYGWDHNVLFVFERDGRLWALIEWLELNPLEEVAPDVYRFPPDGGLYHGEHITFERDSSGRATAAVAGGIPFRRRRVGPEDGSVFRIEPVRPVEELRSEALAAAPPHEEGALAEPDLVELSDLDPSIRLDIRYAGTDNFMSTPFYREPRAFLQRPAAEALARVHQRLEGLGYGLLIHDAYRPWHVTKMFWDATPEDMKIFVADPENGSRHNRGAAVDLTLFRRNTGEPVPMPGVYDEFSERSFPDYPGGTSRQRWHRELLRRAMESEGFAVYEYEWWHFDYEGWERFPILNVTFDALAPVGVP